MSCTFRGKELSQLGRSQPSRCSDTNLVRLMRRTLGVQLAFGSAWPRAATQPAHQARLVRPRPDGDAAIIAQIAMPLARRIAGMTGLMKALEAVLAKLSMSGAAVPNNVILGERIGGHNRSSIDRAFKRLVRCGAVRPEHTQTHRRMWLASTNLLTGWGEYRQGHAPYSTHTRQQLRDQALAQPEPPKLIRLAAPPVLFSIDLGRVCECQWITGSLSRLKPIYCDMPTKGRASYCPEHEQISRRGGASTKAADPDATIPPIRNNGRM